MVVKAKYYKEVEVTDDISQEEIDHICKYGMPDRFDCMADEIDNDQPLEFESWEFVEDTYYKPQKELNKKKKLPLVNILMAILFASIFGSTCGIIEHSLLTTFITFAIYLIAYIIVTTIINWVRKINEHMKGDRK